MNNLSEKGKARLGIAILLISVIVFGFIITPAGIMISNAGAEMADIRSVGGNSVAEAYYQLHGEIYASMGRIIACIGLVICFAGITYSILLLKASKDTLKAMGNEIKMATDDMKERTVRAAHELSKDKSHTAATSNSLSVGVQTSSIEKAEKLCPNCKQPISAESAFCTKCGFKMDAEVEKNVCPSCGTAITSDTVFCTQCGHKISEIQANEGEQK